MYKAINVKPVTHKELRKISFDMEITIVELIERLLENWKLSKANEKK